METDVLIVGAGPTGLALACDLARRGIAYRLLDKAPQYFQGSKGKGLQPRSLEVMDDFGVVEQVIANGQVHLPFKAWDGNTEVGVRDMSEGHDPTPSAPYGSVLITPQWRVEEALRTVLERSGRAVESGMELAGFAQDEDGVTALCKRAGEEFNIRCRYLVGTDGGRSFVRKALAVPFEGETWSTECMYVADVRARGRDREFWHVWGAMNPAKGVMLCPLPSTDQYQLQLPVPGEEDVPEPTFELLQRIVKERTGGADLELVDSTWMSLYRVNIRMVSQYRVGRILLAGDAAHVHTPAGGQGMNTGIQDGYNLGWKLAAVVRGAPDSLLDTYNDERLPVAAEVLGISSRLYKNMRTGGDVEERRQTDMRQLGIHYRDSALSVNAGAVGLKLAAGDRAPDAPGTAPDGSPLRLFDLFRGPHWTLLRLFGSNEALTVMSAADLHVVDVVRSEIPEDKQGATFVDSSGYAAAAYGGVDGTLVLIRPDGYVGWTGHAGAMPELPAYLRGVC